MRLTAASARAGLVGTWPSRRHRQRSPYKQTWLPVSMTTVNLLAAVEADFVVVALAVRLAGVHAREAVAGIAADRLAVRRRIDQGQWPVRLVVPAALHSGGMVAGVARAAQ